MDWEWAGTVAAWVVAIVVTALLFFDAFRGLLRYVSKHSMHAVVSTALLILLSFVNFGIIFGHAWNGDASFDYIIALCLLALSANLYASWSQPQMVWRGGLILCWMILVILSFSPWEDEPIEIFSFWLVRGLPIYLSAAAGGVLSGYIMANQSRNN